MNNKRINRITIIALLSSLAVILNFIEIPYIVSYLKIDLSEVIVLVGLIFSLPVAIAIAAIKAFVMLLLGTTTKGIGELTLFIGSLTIIFSYYLSNKKFNKVISLIIVSVCFTFVMTVLNYFIITPLYYPQSFSELVNQTTTLGNGMTITYLQYIIVLYAPFNLVKISLVSICYYFVSNKLEKIMGQNESNI